MNATATQEFPPQGAEGFWPHDAVTPRETPKSDVIDIQRLRFPFPTQLVVVVVMGFLSAFGGIWASTSSLRSDLAVMRQSQLDQVKYDELKAKLEDERAANTARVLQQLTAQVTMQDTKMNNLRETVLTNLAAQRK